jgi:hypothetical protein
MTPKYPPLLLRFRNIAYILDPKHLTLVMIYSTQQTIDGLSCERDENYAYDV